VIDTIAGGKADLGITFISELLLVEGITVVGPLPEGMRMSNVYTAAIPAWSAAIESARAFIAFLTGPAAGARFASAGLMPP